MLRTDCGRPDEKDVTCVAMSKEFLVFGSARGTIVYFFLPDFAQVNSYRHEKGVCKVLLVA